MPLSINQIPTPVPSSTDPVNFSARGDAVFGAFPNFITQTNAVASEAAANRDSAEASKTAAANSETNAATYAANATTSANNASSSSVASLWVSGTTYAINDKRVSPITGQVYRRKTAGAGTTDPSLDSTNWYAVLLDADTQYPSIKPTLNLDFANSGKLDPRITFTRASTATYFDKLGVLRTANNNEPRFDYDPVTLEAKGLLIEESRQNLALNSEVITASTGTLLTSNATIAPDGNSTADLIYENTSNSEHYAGDRFIAVTAGATYTLSFFVKAASGNRNAYIRFEVQGSAGYRFDFSNETIYDIIPTNMVSKGFQKLSNGWYRLILVVQAATTGNAVFRLQLTNSSSTVYTGDGSSGLYFWGAQLEAGSFPTSYIPTTTTPVTRQADNASMTGSNFTSWYRQDEGAFFAEYMPNRASSGVAVGLDSSNTRRFIIYDAINSLNQSYYIGSGGSISLGTATEGSNVKVAVSFDAASSSGCMNGSSIAVGTQGIQAASRMCIGSENIASNSVNSTIRRITYYPKRLPNYQLQILTK